MQEHQLKITGLDCVDCARGLEASVAAVPGVETAKLQFFDGTLRVRGAVAEDELRKLIDKLGYGVEDETGSTYSPAQEPNALLGFWRFLWGRLESRMALLAGGLILASFFLSLLNLPDWAPIALQLGALAVGLWPVARSAAVTLWVNRTFNINFLMTVAGIGAVIIGEYAEAASMIFLFALAEALEGFTTERARSALASLTDLTPTHAVKLSDGHETIQPVEEISVGDRILVRPGERIPLDGVILEGRSDINQAPVTGESIPVWKEPGDRLFSGTVNGNGRLVFEVTQLVADSTLHRIIELVTEAQEKRSRSQKFIDRFAQYYTPAMMILAVLLAALPPLLFNAPFFNLADGTRGWLHRALALLVIDCPCALVISTPVTMVAGLTKAAREGVLFKGGIFLEKLGRMAAFAFDKTGTLTHGQPQVVARRDLECSGDGDCDACDDMLALAYALERHSTHPLAQAVITEAEKRGLTACYPPAENLTTLGGRGLTGLVQGRMMRIGSRRFFEEEHTIPPFVREWVLETEREGRTAMLLYDGQRVRGFIAVADTPREEARAVIQGLHALGRHTVMLTGDNPTVARAVGDRLGLNSIRADLLPEDKQAAVAELRQKFESVAMVGDGINDAPALAAADIGIAMGGVGSAQALETADVVLMADDIHKLPFAVRLSRFANRLIKENIVISLGSKLLVAILALLGYAPLWIAVLADMGVSLLVTMNGLRALRFEPEI